MNLLDALVTGVRLMISAYVIAWSGWWLLLSIVALPRPGRLRYEPTDERWVVLVPAHNEELMIRECIESLLRASRRVVVAPIVVVIADNCTDRTASIARAAGASVLERSDAAQRGKGYALEYAIHELAAGAFLTAPDVVAFVDADSTVNEDFFRAMQAAMSPGRSAAQAYYQVAHPEADLPRLRALAFMLLHWARPLGLARLRLGGGLKGNGMALRWTVAAEGLGSVGVAEDAAMTLRLAKRGHAVCFAPHARVEGFMAPTYREAHVQDERWEHGRIALMGRAVRTAVHSLVRGRFAAAGSAFEVSAPSFTMLGAMIVLIGGLQAIAPIRGGGALAVGGVSLVSGYLAVGLIAARAPWRSVTALRTVPRFATHKVGVLAGLMRRRDLEWRRTTRHS